MSKDITKIFNNISRKIFFITVRRIDLLSKEELDFYGTVVTSDNKVDKDINKQTIQSGLPILEIIKLRTNGAKLGIPEQTALEIYYHINDYLEYWLEYLNFNMVNIDPVVIESLINMDEFADELYIKVKPLIKKNNENNIIPDNADFYQQLLQAKTHLNPFTTTTPKVNDVNRKQYASDFKKILFNYGRN